MSIDNLEQESSDRLIRQVAEYYNQTKQDIEDYQDMNYTVLEDMAKKHLQHWKKELRTLVFGKVA